MLKEKILQLKKEKNAIILAHFYQRGEIQEIADYVGDSLALSKTAASTNADVIVFCG
nr:quinolinate synthase NadA [Bacillota bacterium]